MKEYLGDAVFAYVDGRNIVLTTEDGYQATNTIVLEPEVTQNLLLFLGKHCNLDIKDARNYG